VPGGPHLHCWNCEPNGTFHRLLPGEYRNKGSEAMPDGQVQVKLELLTVPELPRRQVHGGERLDLLFGLPGRIPRTVEHQQQLQFM
jgi:hypothetical protein